MFLGTSGKSDDAEESTDIFKPLKINLSISTLLTDLPGRKYP